MVNTNGCQLSVILPVFNEEMNLGFLCQRLTKVLTETLGIKDFEIICIDDRSSDGSWAVIQGLHAKDPRVLGVRLSRNFGHHIALTAGINLAQGQAVVLMDSDLQDLPEELPKLVEKYREGYEVVYAIRRAKRHSFFKRVSSRAFNNLMKVLAEPGITINSTVFRIMSRRVVDTFNRFQERDRYTLGLVSYAGFKETGVEVVHGERVAGKTKYNLGKMVRLALNSMTAFSIRPLQLASWFGFILSFVGLIAMIALVVRKIFFNIPVVGWASIMMSIIFIGGIQMLFLGLQGEYIGRIFSEVKQRPLYIVDEELK